MVPWPEYIYYSAIATALHAIIWWHLFPDGNFQPYLMPVSDEVWAAIVH